MPVSLAQVVFDCHDAAALAAFWSQVLDQPVDEGANPFHATVTSGPLRLMFLQVPEPKTVKNRVHVDLTSPDWESDVARVLALGAVQVTKHDEYGTRWATLLDPEGNEFDLGAAHV